MRTGDGGVTSRAWPRAGSVGVWTRGACKYSAMLLCDLPQSRVPAWPLCVSCKGVCCASLQSAHVARRLPGCGAAARDAGWSVRQQLLREGLHSESADYIIELHERLRGVVKTQPSAHTGDGQPEEAGEKISDEENVGLLAGSSEEEEEQEEQEERERARRGRRRAARKELSAVLASPGSAERGEAHAGMQAGEGLDAEDNDSEVEAGQGGWDWDGAEVCEWEGADYQALNSENEDEEEAQEEEEEEEEEQ